MKKRSIFKRLEAKITWQMMMVSLLPIIIIGSFAYYSADQSVRATKDSVQDSRSNLEKTVISTNIVSTAQRTIADIDQLVIGLIEQSIVWTSYPGILQTVSYNGYRFESQGFHEMPKQQVEIAVAEDPYLQSHSILDDYLSKQLAFEEHTKQILVTDSHGLRIASTGLSSDFILSEEPWWKTAWQEGSFVGITKNNDTSVFWGIDIAVRIEHPETGEFLGILKTVLDIAAIQEIATYNANLIQAGNISVFNSDGLLLAETSSANQVAHIMTPKVELSGSTKTAIELAIFSDSISGYSLSDDSVAGFARSSQSSYSESTNGFIGSGWGVVVEQPKDIAFASLNSLGTLKDDLNNSRTELSYAIVGIAVLMALVALFIAIRQSRKITGPISRLREAAERIRMGDEEIEITNETDDEIGDLAVAFGRMFYEHRQAMEFLKDNEERFRTIFENSNDHIIYIDKSGIIVDTNAKIEEIFGYTPEEVIGKNFSDLGMIEVEHFSVIKEYFDRMTKGNIHDGLMEINISHKNGSIISTEANISAVEIDGEIEGILAIVRNVTERKRAEEMRETLLAEKQEHNKYLKKTNMQLEQAYATLEWEKAEREKLVEELADKNGELEQVIYVTSHDLRSPMVNIGGFSRELEMSTGDLRTIAEDEQVPLEIKDKLVSVINIDMSESLDFIQSSVSKMDSLLNGLLQVSRAGRLSPNLEKLDMNDLISDVRNSFEHVIREHRIHVEINDLPSCYGDQPMINQVFSNLLGNALKYLDLKKTGFIQITGHREEDQVIYCIEDNGLGIPNEHQEKVFQMFHRVDLEVAAGEGLGLTIIKKILNKHRGKIWLESEYGVGSKFFVALPAETNVNKFELEYYFNLPNGITK